MYNVGIFLFNDVELLDFAGPFEVFSVTSELNNFTLFNVFTVSNEGQNIKSVNGLRIIPDYSFINHPNIDILIIPGGVGTKSEILKDDVLDWLMNNEKSSKIIMSVCSGARLLGKLGLLDGKECTTHHEVMEHLKDIAPNTIINPDEKFIDCGKILTSAGISAGIDLSLHVVKKLYGVDIENKTKVYMEYGDWKDLICKSDF